MDATFVRLVEEFLDAAPRAVHSRGNAIGKLVCARPELVDALPEPVAVDDDVKRRYVAGWRGAAFASDSDPGRMCALLDGCSPELRAMIVHSLGNRDAATRERWVRLASALLDDPSPDVVASALYFLRQHAADGGVVTSALAATARLVADPRKAGKQKLADAAEAALTAAFANARDTSPVLDALAAIQDSAAKQRAKKLSTRLQARDASPIEHAARLLRAGTPEERITAARTLATLLSVEVMDIRASFDAIARGLGHRESLVREAAADLAVIACEEQGSVEEIVHLVRPLRTARDEGTPELAARATRAIAFLDRHRAAKGLSPLG